MTHVWDNFNASKYSQRVRYHHKKRGFKIDVTSSDILEILELAYYNGCPYCGKMMREPNGDYHPDALSLDIKDPEVRVLSLDNFQIICQECNRKKGRLSHRQYVSKITNFEVKKWKTKRTLGAFFSK